MGRGNVCIHNPYEGLFYVDQDDLMIYVNGDEERTARELSYDELTGSEWQYDQFSTDMHWDAIKEQFSESIQKRFKSFRPCNKRIGRECSALLENELFYIAMEDNEWSIAIELIQKESWYQDLSGLQKKHHKRYLDGIRDALFEHFETLGIYAGAWTSGTIKREEVA